MSNIKVEEIFDPEGYKFIIESSDPKHKDAEVIVEAEHGGHGCLFGIRLPQDIATDFKPMDWIKPNDPDYKDHPKLEDILILINHISKQWNYPYRVVRHLEVEEI